MKKQFVAMVTVLMVTLTAGACVGDTFERGSWRYKVIVAVDTPEGVKTGSAVREVSVKRGLSINPSAGPAIDSRGEAVVVDLGKRGVLFALTSFDDYQVTFDAFPYEYGGLTAKGLRYYRSLKNVSAEIPPQHWPRFVTFTDMNDPKTVQQVLRVAYCRERDKNGECMKDYRGHIDKYAQKKAYIKENRMEEFFGQGVSIKSVTIEMTDKDVTTGVVDKYLPSYADQDEYMKWFKSLPYGDPRRINIYSFK